jgi:hypothetical protein
MELVFELRVLDLDTTHACKPPVPSSPTLNFAAFVVPLLLARRQVHSSISAMCSDEKHNDRADADEKCAIEEHVATSPASPTDISKPPWFKRWNARIESLAGFEARGLSRVHENERHPPFNIALLQMLLLWFSANLTINNLAVTLTGPLLFGLGFVDCALCAIFEVTLGALSTAYMATWGAVSGNRTMVCYQAPLPRLSTQLIVR